MQRARGAVVKVPDFFLLDAMKGRKFRGFQQIIDGGAKRTIALKAVGQCLDSNGFVSTVDFAVETAFFRKRLQLQMIDPVGSGRHVGSGLMRIIGQ